MTMLFLLGGMLLLGAMVWQVGMTGLRHSLQAMGLWVVPWLLLQAIPNMLHTAGWAACFQGSRPPLKLWQLWLVRLSGTAINELTPTATLGGEVVRALLLEAVLPRAQAAAAVVIGKATVTIAHMCYLSIGTLYVLQHLSLPAELRLGLSLTIGLVSLGLAGFVACQRYGALSHVVQRLECLWARRTRAPRLYQYVRALDTQLMTYYTRHPWRFARSVLLHVLGFVAEGVKMYILLRLLLGAHAPGLTGAIKVAIVVAALDQMLFFVPGHLGTMEGVRFMVLSRLGVAQIYGLAFGLIARLEYLVWSGLGLLAYGLCIRYPALLQPAWSTTPHTPVSPTLEDG
jgi:uncharacterized protein (TIRG00374 family)